jgi:hypothetical protein
MSHRFLALMIALASLTLSPLASQTAKSAPVFVRLTCPVTEASYTLSKPLTGFQ